MTHPVNFNTTETISVSTYQKQSQTAELSQQGGALQVTSSTTLAESTVVTLQSSATARPVQGTDAAHELGPQDVANNILQMISQRLAQLQSQGASTEQLQLKLEDAQQGFAQGVAESRDILESLGILDAGQQSRIDKIVERFNQGVEKIAKHLTASNNDLADAVKNETQDQILSTPTTASGNTQTSPSLPNVNTKTGVEHDSAVTSASVGHDDARSGFVSRFQQSRVAFAQQQSLDLQLRTQDGDTVTVRFFSQQSGGASSTAASFGNGQFQLSSSQQFSQLFGSTELQVSVEGEIDKNELAALESLFAQLSEIASAFFNAEDGEAFSQALNLNVNSDEIAQFSFDLQSREIQQITQRYRDVAALDNDKGHAKHVGHGHHHHGLLQQLRDKAIEQSQVSFEQQFVEQLLSVSFAAASTALDQETASEQQSAASKTDNVDAEAASLPVANEAAAEESVLEALV